MQQSKFLRQPAARQHKYAAKLVRELYTHYQEVASWMELPPLPSKSPEQLSNRFHHHQQQTTQGLREESLLPPVRQGDRVSHAPYLPITIYLDHLRSAHNVGSIIRTVEAFRLGSLVFSEQTPDCSHRQVQRTSMGTWKAVPHAENSQGPVIALETSPEAIPLEEFSFPSEFTLVVGNEEYGCSEKTLAAADALIEIPLVGSKNSLNVANAFAIVAATIRGQLS